MTSGMEVQHIYMSKLTNFNTYSIYAMHAVGTCVWCINNEQ